MRNFYILVSVFCLPIFLFSQNFFLIGPRVDGGDTYGWDGGIPVSVAQDASGNYQIYIDEVQSPRNPEIVILDAASETYTDRTMNGLTTPIYSDTHAVMMPDGSAYAAFSELNSQVWVTYGLKINADNTSEYLGGEMPIAGSDGIYVKSTLDTDSNFYIAAVGLGGFVNKYSGGAWSMLPNFDTYDATIGTVYYNIDIDSDSDNNLYLAYADRPDSGAGSDTFNARLLKLEDGATEWTTLFVENVQSVAGNAYVVSPTEVYYTYAKYDTSLDSVAFYVLKYDGTSVSSVGGPIAYQDGFCDTAEIIKLNSNGKLYLSNCENIYEYDADNSVWNVINNDIADGGAVASYEDILFENADGNLIIITGFDEDLAVIECPITLGTVEYDAAHTFSVYPNPTSDLVVIKADQEPITLVEVFSAEGMLLDSYELEQMDQAEIDLSAQKAGVYLVRINKNQTQKVVKK